MNKKKFHKIKSHQKFGLFFSQQYFKKPFNVIGRNEKHINDCVPEKKSNFINKKEKNHDQNNDDKNIIKYIIRQKTLLNMHLLL